MGIAPNIEGAARITSVPFVCFVSPPADSPTLAGEIVRRGDIDLVVRVISSGQPHRALPLTVSLCTAVAARIGGTLVAEALSQSAQDGALRLGMPSGILTVGAEVAQENGSWVTHAGSFYRTARRLFDGRVWVPARKVAR
jgi:2-methylaconitate cis-trans-isomerase PrpF